MSARSPVAGIDHLVIAAASLTAGVAWCERTLGVTPGPGGQHALMGTHNRLFQVSSSAHPSTYLEIIAVDEVATRELRASEPHVGDAADPLAWRRTRWFDLDSAALRAQIQTGGPQLVHWVASVPDAAAALAQWQLRGIERGELLHASRPTPAGLLQWQISVRDDGQRLFGGCLPTLIEWGHTHPSATMAPSGVTLLGLELAHPQATILQAALGDLPLNVPVREGPVCVQATLQTPLGVVVLHSAPLID